MVSYLEIIQNIYNDVLFATTNYMGDAFTLTSTDISERSADFAYPLCHPILGNLLEFGLSQGNRTDKPAIRVALEYCAYAGMVGNAREKEAFKYTPEELFYQIAQQDGMLRWIENARGIINLDKDSNAAKQISLFFNRCVDLLSCELPEIINDQEGEIHCVDACAVMFFIGKSISVL